MAWQFVETDEDGNHIQVVQEAYLDGYAFGDRQLEGVWFGFRIAPNGSDLEAFVPPASREYMRRLNTGEWLHIAMEYAMQADCFASDPDEDDDAIILVKK